jgi:hypothetical protein
MKEKFLDNLNAILCAFIGFTTLILLGCPALSIYTSTGGFIISRGYHSSIDAFQAFEYSKFAANGGAQNAGALAAAGVFSVFVLIAASVLLVVGVFTLLKKSGIFDWKIDEKLGNFDLIVKILMSCFAFFAFLAFVCVGAFAAPYKTVFIGGGAAAIFALGAAACAVMWLLPIILKKTAKKTATAAADGAATDNAEPVSKAASEKKVVKEVKEVEEVRSEKAAADAKPDDAKKTVKKTEKTQAEETKKSKNRIT